MNNIEILSDIEIKQLSSLASEIWREYWTIILSTEQIEYMLDKFQSFEAIKNQILNENYIYRIINKNNINIGYFGVCPKPNYLFLSKFYIKKDHRNKGIGKETFELIKTIAKKHNKKSIQLTVNKHNINTIEAYKKWGFEIINSVVTDIGNNFVMDDYIMEYQLQEN